MNGLSVVFLGMLILGVSLLGLSQNAASNRISDVRRLERHRTLLWTSLGGGLVIMVGSGITFWSVVPWPL